MSFNPQIHHRKSIRLQGYDYAGEGAYFITICTHNRSCIFGTVNDGNMLLNAAGRTATDEWYKTIAIRKNITLTAFIVMPNHIHGIIIIDKKAQPDLEKPNAPVQKMRSPSQTIGAIIRGYKSAVTKRLSELAFTTDGNVWQRGYHDHIIRNELSYNKIENYIINNPALWKEDMFFGNQ